MLLSVVLTTFWKSRLPDGEWRTLIESLHERCDEPPVPVLGIGMPVPATVDTNGLAGRTSLREAAREARFTGGPDSALLDIIDGLGVPRVDHGTEFAVLDAWLGSTNRAAGTRHTGGWTWWWCCGPWTSAGSGSTGRTWSAERGPWLTRSGCSTELERDSSTAPGTTVHFCRSRPVTSRP
ncbi:hypothetical protein [Lentzea jiangxiensis]|uniref:Uncharacterized protein n=1 Tax=Lentzea jiangxiensis TaxID=641025 RepID=A0A1H0IWX6_9PSEU|nr:hypothetical protein [Lentzea jiangxiensis]SDO35739.1 hypothetical protein SAMN05421507_102270 [Lentzea jiangxiensis]